MAAIRDFMAAYGPRAKHIYVDQGVRLVQNMWAVDRDHLRLRPGTFDVENVRLAKDAATRRPSYTKLLLRMHPPTHHPPHSRHKLSFCAR
jgi:hypothetical protein